MSLDFRAIIDYLPLLVSGFGYTVFFTVTSLALGLLIGLVVAVLRAFPSRITRAVGLIFVEAVRGTPLLVILFMLYYALPQFGIRMSAVTAGVLGLAINGGAYIAEIFRAGIEAVPRGHVEAARATGLSYTQTMMRIILPQASRIVIPPLTNEAISLVKATSLVSTLAIAELLRSGQQIISVTFAAFEVYMVVAAMYLIVNLLLAWLARRLEQRLRRSDRPNLDLNDNSAAA
jgi:His/Glu/Gln/Arg/opine family amino acid ABC transporter permease subunit